MNNTLLKGSQQLMNRKLCIAAFIVGAAVIAWIGAGYFGSHPLALAMTIIIAGVYGAGALEMWRFHQATGALLQALSSIPPDLASLGDWLCRLPVKLRDAVRLRVEGERSGLPGPALTPYLVGLLVMLGMLGTFLGLVVTLNGAVLALESTTDLQTIRASLAAPVKGLGLAFGTSVAGVAASAMLGLISVLCRRERLQASQLLDMRIAEELRAFSLVHQRQETFRALQAQSQSLPELVVALQAMMGQMERHNERLNERLLAGQEGLHRDVREAYGLLARDVDQTLKASLAESTRLAGDSLRPAVAAAMAAIAQESATAHERMASTVAQQLDGVTVRLDGAVGNMVGAWSAAVAEQERSNRVLAAALDSSLERFGECFDARAGHLIAGVREAQGSLLASQAAHDEARTASLTAALEAMAGSLQHEWQSAGAQTLERQQEICRTLEATAQEISRHAQTHAERTIDEVARLMQTASEAPRVAAEVIGQLRQQLSDSVVRDNQLLEERARLMDGLAALVDEAGRSAERQQAAVEAMTDAATVMVERAGTAFAERMAEESGKLGEVAAEVTAGAVEVASLAEAFGGSVDRFGEANGALAASLARIEEALERSSLRSDDQLAYYLAQARELIDLSVLSQQRIVEELRQRMATPAALVAEVC